MKLTLIILLCILCPVLANGQLLQIDFDRPDSGVLEDNSRYGHQINHYGDLNYVADRFGNGCRAAEFTGSQFLEIPAEQFFDIDQEFTAMAWLKLPADQDLQWITLICKGLHSQESSKSPAFRVQMTSRTVSVNTSSTKEIDEITQSFPEDRWFHFATTFDNGEIVLYVDGQQYRSFYTSTYLKNNNHSVTIGYDVPGDEEYFKGAMDDLYFFDKVLRPKEITRYARDKRNANAGGICPADPPAKDKPVVIASTDPWQQISIDEVDDLPVDDPVAVTTTKPDPVDKTGKKPPVSPAGWDDIPIDDVTIDPPANGDPVTKLPPADPWAGVAIDEFPDNEPDLPDDIAARQTPDIRTGKPVIVPVDVRKYPIVTLRSKKIADPLSAKSVIPGRVKMETVDLPEPQFYFHPDPEPVQEEPQVVTTDIPDMPDDPKAGEPLVSEPIMVGDMDSLTVGKKMILDKIEFARHRHHLNDRSKNVLKKLAAVLRKNPEYNILLEGHTEIDGNREANMALSQRRADACRDYLIKRWKIKPRRIEVQYHGPDRPITRKKSILWKNRRVEVTVF